ncbi:hypothetical protein GGS24DRAFT_145274 [Hypoxylon argillaceum]|nr:hypothetical protein GGS24DRAFT_145274 [Hypoxylon argillaceum]
MASKLTRIAIVSDDKNVVRSARNPARWFVLESSVLRSHLTPDSPSSPRLSVSVAAYVRKNALLAQLPLSICPQISRARLPTDTLPIASRFTACPRLDQARCWVLSVPTVLAKVRP